MRQRNEFARYRHYHSHRLLGDDALLKDAESFADSSQIRLKEISIPDIPRDSREGGVMANIAERGRSADCKSAYAGIRRRNVERNKRWRGEMPRIHAHHLIMKRLQCQVTGDSVFFGNRLHH